MKHTVLITGAAKGIGRAVAERFAQTGANVAVHYFNSSNEAELLADKLVSAGVRAVTVRADVSDSEQVGEMFCRVEAALGAVDILVNNAGIPLVSMLQDTAEAQARRVMDVNFFGTFFCCKRAIPAMLSRGWGRIVNISSVFGCMGGSCEAVYSASKAAVIGLTKALARETGLSGVTVNAIAPGAVETDMTAHLTAEEKLNLSQSIALGRLGTPEEAAAAAVFLASEQASYITAQVIAADGGWI